MSPISKRVTLACGLFNAKVASSMSTVADWVEFQTLLWPNKHAPESNLLHGLNLRWRTQTHLFQGFVIGFDFRLHGESMFRFGWLARNISGERWYYETQLDNFRFQTLHYCFKSSPTNITFAPILGSRDHPKVFDPAIWTDGTHIERTDVYNPPRQHSYR